MLRSWQTFRTIPRLRKILMIVAKHGFGQILSNLHLPIATQVLHFFKNKQPETVLSRPQRLRHLLEELGPTFVKFGQLLATRPDMIPPDYINELNKLQDEVDPLPFEKIKPVMDEELGNNLENIFDSIAEKPIGSASIAQVHRATLKNGTEVVIKIQRPGIKKTIKQDLQILVLIADLVSEMEELAHFDPVSTVRVFERAISRELDFRHELHNSNNIAKNCKSNLIKIPRSFPEFSGQRILTMEYCNGSGIKKQKFTPEQGSTAGKELVKTMFDQIFINGIFHADPHPGNLILSPDGKLCIIDFGSVGRLGPSAINELIGFITSIIHRDYRLLARQILRSGHMKAEVDRKEFSAELLDYMDPYYGLPLSEIEIAPLVNDTFTILLQHRIRIPEQYVLLARTLMILEGTLQILDPEFCLVDALKPYAKKLFLERWKPDNLIRELRLDFYDITTTLRDMPSAVGDVIQRFQRGNIRTKIIIEKTDSIDRRLDRLNVQIPMGLMASSIFLSGTIALVYRPESTYSLPLAISAYVLSGLMGLWLLRPKKK